MDTPPTHAHATPISPPRDAAPLSASLILQLGLLSTGLLLIRTGYTLWEDTQPLHYLEHLLLCFAAISAGGILIGLAAQKRLPPPVAWIILIALIGVMFGIRYKHDVNYTPVTANHPDTEMIANFSVEALRQGENPYAWDFTDMVRVNRVRSLHVTPFADGSYQNRFAYPALPLLVYYATDFIGFDGVNSATFGLHILLIVTLFVSTPQQYRPVILLPMFVLEDYVNFTLGGNQDIVWSLLLVGVILAWQRPVWRAVLFGLASAFRQQPWFVGPFLLIHLWNEYPTRQARLRAIAVFLAISIGVFGLINAPFALWDFRAWFGGVFEHAQAPFNVLSHGPSVVTQIGSIMLARTFYTIVQIAMYLIMFVVHWRHPRLIGQAFWLFTGVYFWFYYRGLINYWIYWIPPLLVAFIHQLDQRNARPDQAANEVYTTMENPAARMGGINFAQGWRLTAAITIGIAVVGVGVALILGQSAGSVSIEYAWPMRTDGKWINQISLTVTNEGDQTITPRFAAQHDAGTQALPWVIISGPDQLAPGESGEYVISADALPERQLPASQGGQLVFTDAGGDYALRTIVDIPSDVSFVEVDAIRNPAYRYWSQGNRQVPQGWELRFNPVSTVNLDMKTVDNRAALVFEVEIPVYTRLSQDITNLDRFDIWVYPTVIAESPFEELYGLEFFDGVHKLWVLFGGEARTGTISGTHRYVYMPAPVNQWSKQTIELAQLYEQLDWDLPPYSNRYRDGLLYRTRQIDLGLIIASGMRTEGSWIFGPIEQSTQAANTNERIQHVFDRPEEYYLNLGSEYHRQRNYDLAVDAYQRAITYNDENPAIFYRLAQSYFWLKDWGNAVDAYAATVDLGYEPLGLAFKGLGWSHYYQENYPAAEDSFAQALTAINQGLDLYSASDRTDTLNGRGWSLARLDDCTQALPFFQQAARIAPGKRLTEQGLKHCAAANTTPVPPAVRNPARYGITITKH